MGQAQSGKPRRRMAGSLAAAGLGAILAVTLGYGVPAASASSGHRTSPPKTLPATDWSSYLNGPRHTSYASTQKTITASTVSKLKRKWAFTGGDGFLASPTVAEGAVFIGANNGWFYKLSETTGRVEHKIFLGTVKITTCPPPPTGMVATATVALDPKNHQPVVYADGANGYLYALQASNLRVKWKSVIGIPSSKVNDYFDWSSPTVANGRIYMGVTSNCDTPLVRGAVVSYSQETGKKLNEFYTVPPGSANYGGSVWSSAAVAPNGDVYATTGNGPLNGNQLLADSESIIKLSPTLRFLGRYQVPLSSEGYDTDFGASPVFFDQYVGACNKNGVFYAAYQSSMKLAWRQQISGPAGDVAECIAAPVWNGKHLWFGIPSTTIGSTSYPGGIEERDPNGHLIWETGLPDGVCGSPSMDGAGIIAVGTYDYQSTPNGTYLVNASNGHILRELTTGWDFSQTAFANNWLFMANGNGLYAWGAGKGG
jgi:outer membrane protein assembly factor BamB